MSNRDNMRALAEDIEAVRRKEAICRIGNVTHRERPRLVSRRFVCR